MEVEVIKAKETKGSIIPKLKNRLRVAAYARVSTDTKDQLNSFQSQKEYYTDLINNNKDYELVRVYADPGITGTQTINRIEFREMIDEALKGNIDLIITKSISRFARNTVDTLNYVRKLKEKHVAVLFEEEHINTLTMDGELLLTVLSSVAQQEVENISNNVKKGLRMKMERGELVGFNGCIGYNYIPETKSLVVNEYEKEIIKLIFKLYLEGYGANRICKYLEEKGYKNRKGENKWVASTISSIIRNEKYIGDVLLGKTYTIDPISKRRVDNKGENDRFYIKNHHEPIIDVETFKIANEIMDKRSGPRKQGSNYSRYKNHPFTFILKCGFCNSNLTRRTQYQNKKIWVCSKAVKEGKRSCRYSLAINEKLIEEAFIESFNILIRNEENIVDEFIDIIKDTLINNDVKKDIESKELELTKLNNKKELLLKEYTESRIDNETYSKLTLDINNKIDKIKYDIDEIKRISDSYVDIKRRIEDLKEYLSKHKLIKEFSIEIFNELIDSIYVGEINDKGINDPHVIEIVYKLSKTPTTNRILVGTFDTRFDYFYYPIDPDGFRNKVLRHYIKTKISFRY